MILLNAHMIEQALYIRHRSHGRTLFVSLYVDDLIFIRDDDDLMNEFKMSKVKES